jgi:hypothetical protein
VDYDTISAEVRRLSYDLLGAAQTAVAAEQARLRRLAAEIKDDVSRRSALARIDALPGLVAGPRLGTSPQYEQAVALVGRAHGLTGPVTDRIAEARRIREAIGELARQAPTDESTTILRMNSTVARMIEDLEAGTRRRR